MNVIARRIGRFAACALSTAAVAVALAGLAVAASVSGGNLHDARYCEILELKGTPPTARVIVWNTIGLNGCPAKWWTGLNAASLAKEFGDTAVVLNGPRHFLMDSATAVTGRTRSFHGERLTMVASVPVRSSADLDQTPYVDRIVSRTNTWRWRAGRTVFELVAPGGDIYVMQSYAQIKDPALTLGKLSGLGRRLTLPAGWRYRSVTLRRGLVLVARKQATVLQDEFLDTYQLAAGTRPPGRRVSRRIHIDGRTREVHPQTPGMIEDHGTLTGKPFGGGSIVLVVRLHDGLFEGTFRLLFARGSIVGSASLPFTISGNSITFAGTAHFTGGTGAYRGITSGSLEVHDHNTLDGQHGVLTVDGFATYLLPATARSS